MRQNITSGAKWEDLVGYSRAVRIGPNVWVAGTTAVSGAGEVIGEGNAYEQAAFIFRKIEVALQKAGASLSDVVTTRMYITRVEDQEAIGKAHFEAVGGVRPAATMVQVSALVDSRLLVEIEVDAFLEHA